MAGGSGSFAEDEAGRVVGGIVEVIYSKLTIKGAE